MRLHEGTPAERLAGVLSENLYGVELDPLLRAHALRKIEDEFGALPANHNLILGDFFAVEYPDRKSVV